MVPQTVALVGCLVIGLLLWRFRLRVARALWSLQPAVVKGSESRLRWWVIALEVMAVVLVMAGVGGLVWRLG